MKYFIPAIAWSLIILYLSAGPGIQLPESWWDIFSVDKVGHFVMYGVQTMLLLYAFRAINKMKWIWPILISIVFGVGMEWMQYQFFPNRFFEVLDIIANIIGSLVGAYCFNRFFTTKPL